jgi:CRISPR-associated protein Csx10
MAERNFTLTLLDDVCISSTAATTGDRSTLQFVPGAMLLGAAAAATRLFDTDRAQANRLFHTGGISFSNATPLTADGKRLFRAPLSMHQIKGERSASQWHNRAVGASTVRQLQQIRGVWVSIETGKDGSLHFEKHEVETRYSMRTSINPATEGAAKAGMARDGLLYGIDALSAGQTFGFSLSSDRADDLAQAADALTRQGTLRVGRSRSAEFGRARVSTGVVGAEPESGKLEGQSQVVVWLLSDAQIRDAETGELTATPGASDFGLPASWTPRLDRWFVRTRRYSGWNTHRRRPTAERWVLEAGSVLVFEGAQPLTEQQANDVTERVRIGGGELTAEGLGRFCCNHTLLLAQTVPVISGDL